MAARRLWGAMLVYDRWTDLPQTARGASVALGNFDGVHLGHQQVIRLAAGMGAPAGVLTFEPHPREYFAPDAPPFRLMNAAARAHRLQKLGLDRLFQLPFDARLAAMSAEEFAQVVLDRGLGVAHVVVGQDFRFGKGRTGTVATLRDLGAALGFGVTVADLIATEAGEVSSTAIRIALSQGEPRRAAAMLGHWHRIDGPVIHGEKRGRTLGYPTANMALDRLHLPRFGVYAVSVDVLDGPHRGTYGGAASLGVRPMFGVNAPNLESYLFDFSGDIYGAEVSVALIDYLRPEMKFDGLSALMDQMAADSAAARAILHDLA